MAGDWGDPIAYVVLEHGVPVVASDHSEIGTVEHVLFDPEEDVFDGIVIRTDSGDRFVDRDQIDAIYERCVVTALSAGEANALPGPDPGQPVFKDDPSVGAGKSLRDHYLRLFRKGGWFEQGSGENEMKGKD